MQTEGPHSGNGDNRTEAESNVVRFPRDWIGPREHLVPFGPGADPPRQTTAPFGLPPSADDFWGEDSASVQDALQAPDRIELGESDATLDQPERVRGPQHDAGRPAPWAPRFPRRVSGSAASDSSESASPRRHRARTLLGLVAIAAGVALVIGHLISAQDNRSAATTATSKSRDYGLYFAGLKHSLGGAVPHASQEIASRVRTSARRRPRQPPPRHQHKPRKSSHASGSPTTSYVAANGGSGGSAGAATATTSSSSAATASPAGTTASPTDTTQSSSVSNDSGGGGSSGGGASSGGSGGSSSGGGSSGSGPVGPGAPFGPGKLG